MEGRRISQWGQWVGRLKLAAAAAATAVAVAASQQEHNRLFH